MVRNDYRIRTSNKSKTAKRAELCIRQSQSRADDVRHNREKGLTKHGNDVMLIAK